MAHGYTNRCTRTGVIVTKAYQGPGAQDRCAREAVALAAVAGLLPVPQVISAGPTSLQMRLLPGVHGQDLIEAGRPEPVLAACGRILRRLHGLRVPPALARAGAVGTDVLVHGDFGPNNVLLDPGADAVTAVLDWEWAHAGDPIDDLAWCEFIMRLHHPRDAWALDAFYAAYGHRPAWQDVKQAIVSRCRQMREFCDRWEPGGTAATRWDDRLAVVRSWSD